jgi:hypothetical protein
MFALSARLAPTTSLTPEVSQRYRSIAEKEIFQTEGILQSNIDTITALFLLSLHSHGEGKQRQAWVICGMCPVYPQMPRSEENKALTMQPAHYRERVLIFKFRACNNYGS